MTRKDWQAVGFLVFGSLAMMAARAWGAEVHADYRYAFGSCPTWGSGRFSEVRAWVRVKEKWDATSNYPVGWSVVAAGKAECQYKGDPAPMAKPGEWIAPGNLCKPKLVIPKVCAGGPNDFLRCHVASDCPQGACVPGTAAATSFPWSWVAYEANYNEGWSSVPSGCTWDPWAYGAPPVPTTTTTMP